ncbi:MAG: RsmB/NOP family class I SAM-dependent RNA methyltransferase [Thermoanaerobaculia bacterium]
MAFAPERYREIVDDWPAFLEAVRRPLPLTVRVNRLRAVAGRGAAPVREWLEAEGLRVRPVPWDGDLLRLEPRPDGPAEPPAPGRLLATLGGLVHVQEEVSLLPVRLLAPRPGERVLDLCAAPGSKAGALAAAMAGRGTLVANDVDWRRLSSLGRNLERLGALNAVVTCYDAANFPFAAGCFDRVLADVPCTCEGTSRKNPEVFTWGDPASRSETARVQGAVLRKAVRLVRPGGRVVYSTCTYAPEENEAVVDAVLAAARRAGRPLRVLDARVDGFPAAAGLREWRGERFDPALERALRVWPHHHDTGGFFVAVLEREGTRETSPADVAEPELPATVEPGPWLGPVRERFGLPEEVFAGTGLVQRGRGVLALVADDLRAPRHPRPSSVGVGLLHAGMRNPKLTTAGAMAVGPAATRNVVDLDAEELRAYIARRDQELPAGRADACTGGYVLVRHRGACFGVGWLRPAPAGGRASLRSLFPKRW